MPHTANGEVELYFETFGSTSDPLLLLVNGLGSQSINYADEWCEMFAAEGFGVIRFDNRDTGLSSKLDGMPYSVRDMAGDARSVIDAVLSDGSRAAELAEIDLPALVLHGSRDTLITPSGGRQTAEVIPGARYVEIDGMGHDYPRAVWRRWVDEWAGFVRSI